MVRLSTFVAVIVGFTSALPSVRGGQPFRFPEGKYGKGELKYINDLPVVTLAGTPEEIGEQMRMLTRSASPHLLTYPMNFLKTKVPSNRGRNTSWPELVQLGKRMLDHFPLDQRREYESAVKGTLLGRNLLLIGNTMFDLEKISQCSALIVEPSRSATREMLFGRILDIPSLGVLNEFSLVVVYRPTGKHAFVSIGFPGMLGCISGMNDAGLTLATLEVLSTKDGSPSFNPQGTPYALCFRRLVEECATVEEAARLLRSMNRTTCVNLAICDTKKAAVFEITPKNLVVRPAENGLCLCTNHFRTPELATTIDCPRYRILEKSQEMPKLGLKDVAQKMDEVNLGPLTIQTMIFEPASLKLHLAIGSCPTTKLPLKTLALAPLFGKEP
jgi:isopenicillin-N N-acyltransferase-like protein